MPESGRVPEAVPGPFPAQRGTACPGSLPHRAADRIAQQELRYHRRQHPRDLGATTPRSVVHDGLGRGGSQRSARPAAASASQRGRRRSDLRRHRLRQARTLFGGRRPSVLRHPGQERQLPGHRQLPLCRAHAGLAGRHPALLASFLGRGSNPKAAGPRSPGGFLPDQAADRLGPVGPRPGLGRALFLRDGRRGLRRQS